MSARVIAQQVLTANGIVGKEPRIPPLTDLAVLARAYLSLTDGTGPTLGEQGQVYCTLAAVEAYANHEDIRNEEARRELTEILLDARNVEGNQWRFRSRSTGLDITARVVHEGRLIVVTSISVRERNAGGRRG